MTVIVGFSSALPVPSPPPNILRFSKKKKKKNLSFPLGLCNGHHHPMCTPWRTSWRQAGGRLTGASDAEERPGKNDLRGKTTLAQERRLLQRHLQQRELESGCRDQTDGVFL